jgi:flagellar biosynthesis protein
VTPARPVAQAVALRYEANARAPRIVAKGEGFLAQALVARAEAAGVPVNEAPELAELLMQLDLDRVIPPELFAVVAQVLVWAYSVDERPVSGDRPGAAPA